jgi:hypothetical protein
MRRREKLPVSTGNPKRGRNALGRDVFGEARTRQPRHRHFEASLRGRSVGLRPRDGGGPDRPDECNEKFRTCSVRIVGVTHCLMSHSAKGDNFNTSFRKRRSMCLLESFRCV